MSQGGRYLHLDNAVVGADVQNLTAELVSQAGDGIQVLVLVAQGLALGKVAGVVLLNGLGILVVLLAFERVRRGGDLAVVLEQLLEELRAKYGDLGKEQLTLDESGVGVVQNSPDGDEVVQLAASLLDDAVLALKDDSHAREVLNLGVANN